MCPWQSHAGQTEESSTELPAVGGAEESPDSALLAGADAEPAELCSGPAARRSPDTAGQLTLIANPTRVSTGQSGDFASHLADTATSLWRMLFGTSGQPGAIPKNDATLLLSVIVKSAFSRPLELG